MKISLSESDYATLQNVFALAIATADREPFLESTVTGFQRLQSGIAAQSKPE